MGDQRILAAAAPALFVVIWATGFVVARLVAPHSDPFAFLAVRFVLAGGVLAVAALAAGASWPAGWRRWRDCAVAGLLLHGGYLCAVFWAVAHGLPAGIVALIAGTQPLLTALIAGPVLGEPISRRQGLGLALGISGVAIVLSPRLGGPDPIPPLSVLVAFLGTASIAAGTIWQKRRGGGIDIRTGTAIQYGAAGIVAILATTFAGEWRMDGSPPLLVGLAWAVLGLSIGAIGLFFLLIRRGAVVGVASLMFMVPPVAALMGFGFFGETLSAVQFGGMALAALGLALATRPRPTS